MEDLGGDLSFADSLVISRMARNSEGFSRHNVADQKNTLSPKSLLVFWTKIRYGTKFAQIQGNKYKNYSFS